MRYRTLPTLALALSATLAAACGSSDATGPGDTGDAFMSATIDGVDWSATIGFTASYNGGILAFAGSDPSQRTLGIGLIPVNGPGSYPIGTSQPTNAVYSEGGTTSWNADAFMGSGVVTVTSISEAGASGTFSFTVESDADGSSKVITNGKFDVTF